MRAIFYLNIVYTKKQETLTWFFILQLTSLSATAMHRIKAKKACGSEWQKGSVHIGFCNCARAVVHIALNILSVVDERDCLFAV